MTGTDAGLADLLEADDAASAGSGAMALVLAVAACCVGEDMYRAAHLPADNGRRVLYLAAHDRGPLAPLAQLLRLAGAEPVGLGDAVGCALPILQDALRDLRAAALVWRQGEGAPSLPEAAWAARRAGVPLVAYAPDAPGAVACLDAGAALAAVEAAMGRGAVAGDAGLVAACRLHRRFLGRLGPGLD